MKRNKKNILNLIKKIPLGLFFFLLAMPASTNFKLKDYGFGTGGTSNSTSPNYAIEAITGELSGAKATSPNYQVGPGLIFTNQANVPGAPTFTNPSNYYNKLKIVLNNGGNPSDTKFAIAISADNFATTNYVQSDNTVGAVLGAEDYQTYAQWGGASGVTIIGLTPGTTYKVKVKAIQGKFTETGYGPTASAATINPTLSFGINTNTINFGTIVIGAVNTAPQDVVASFDTNAEAGGSVFVSGANAGLQSTTVSYTINSATADLSVASTGFGAQGISATQTSGGPLSIVSPYDGAVDNVGITDTNNRVIFDTVNPIVGGSGTFRLKAKAANITPAANDYRETLTVIASGKF